MFTSEIKKAVCNKRAAVIIPITAQGEMLTLRRTHTCPKYPLHWNFPGGYVNVGERVLDGAVRELFEETGLCVNPNQLTYSFDYVERLFGIPNTHIFVFTLACSRKFVPFIHRNTCNTCFGSNKEKILEHDLYFWSSLQSVPLPATPGTLVVAQALNNKHRSNTHRSNSK